MNAPTIAAISTPAGQGGIGIIRLSGPRAIDIALSVFVPEILKGADTRARSVHCREFFPASRRIYYGHIVDPATSRILDEVLFFVMRSPHSYTAEDTAEIQTHAGSLVMQSILDLLLAAGARLAEPGEFTRRAFLNGRIDLTQAEAVADIICARSQSALDSALAHMSGGLRGAIKRLRNRLLDTLVSMEAAIDFPDEIGDSDPPLDIAHRLASGILSELDALIQSHCEANFLRDGLKVAIVGGPNVGKSSIFNRLLDRDRAIVSETPGTTRDYIEDFLVIQGIPVNLTDTAGIRENPEPLESLGIGKSWKTVASSDMVLMVMDAGVPATTADLERFMRLKYKKIILVINKMDLPETDFCFTVPVEMEHLPCCRMSALQNFGVDSLRHLIANAVSPSLVNRHDGIIPNLRQKHLLGKARNAVSAAVGSLRGNHLFELACIDLQTAIDALGEVVGDNIRPDVLDDIFSRFCIGK